MTMRIHNPNHKLISNNGAVLWVPRSSVEVDLAAPDVYAQSSAQLYPLGSRLLGSLFLVEQLLTATKVPLTLQANMQ